MCRYCYCCYFCYIYINLYIINNNIISIVEGLNFKKSICSNKMFSDFLEWSYGPRKKKAPLYVLYHNKDQLFVLIITSYYT